MPKNLVVLCDGTWNKEVKTKDSSPSNVAKLARGLSDRQGNNPLMEKREPYMVHTREANLKMIIPKQVVYYDRGVGTGGLIDKFLGGAFGRGIQENIMQAYGFLVDHYDPGDRIYVFGFSRGAYTVRSLIGMIRNVGLADRTKIPQDGRELKMFYKKCLDLYKSRSDKVDSDRASKHRGEFAYPSRGITDTLPDGTERNTDQQNGVMIHFMGVWDTVGALGIPWCDDLYHKYISFHDTRLSKIVKSAKHALAIDDHRELYDPTLWTAKPEWTDSEQRWFPGAHSDIGGGYSSDDDNGTMSDVAFNWILTEAKGAGLYVPPVFFEAVHKKRKRNRSFNGCNQPIEVTSTIHDPSLGKSVNRKLGRGSGDERLSKEAKTRNTKRKDYYPLNLTKALTKVNCKGYF